MTAPVPVLVAGAGGMLGRAVTRELLARAIPHRAAARCEVDITDPGSIRRALDAGRFRAVINCAAYTDVDRAETDEPAAHRLNAEGPAVLAEACRDAGALLLHVSTDYVFDGAGHEPYTVDHPVAPIGAYGRTKAEGERRIAEVRGEHLIIRTSWLYAPWARNFVRTMAALTRDKTALRVVNDQHGTPTSAANLAARMLDLAAAGVRGIAHVTDGGRCTWHELACAVRDGLGHRCDIAPCTTAEFPRPAPRPAYSVLDLARTEAITGPMPGWRQGLSRTLPLLEPF
jgi:dTDP-4-dehydrorhamnose reductase